MNATQLLYGKAIAEAMNLDQLLKDIAQRETKNIVINGDEGKELKQNLEFLIAEGYIEQKGSLYSISPRGKLKLAGGGFLAAAKKEQNAVFAFWISITALLISIVSLVIGFFIR